MMKCKGSMLRSMYERQALTGVLDVRNSMFVAYGSFNSMFVTRCS